MDLNREDDGKTYTIKDEKTGYFETGRSNGVPSKDYFDSWAEKESNRDYADHGDSAMRVKSWLGIIGSSTVFVPGALITGMSLWVAHMTHEVKPFLAQIPSNVMQNHIQLLAPKTPLDFWTTMFLMGVGATALGAYGVLRNIEWRNSLKAPLDAAMRSDIEAFLQRNLKVTDAGGNASRLTFTGLNGLLQARENSGIIDLVIKRSVIDVIGNHIIEPVVFNRGSFRIQVLTTVKVDDKQKQEIIQSIAGVLVDMAMRVKDWAGLIGSSMTLIPGGALIGASLWRAHMTHEVIPFLAQIPSNVLHNYVHLVAPTTPLDFWTTLFLIGVGATASGVVVAKRSIEWNRGGIDLSQQDAALRVTKDINGGVKVNVDPALIARIEREGMFEVHPVIIDIRPADARAIFGVQVVIKTPAISPVQ